jgi:hypothetical protein
MYNLQKVKLGIFEGQVKHGFVNGGDNVAICWLSDVEQC